MKIEFEKTKKIAQIDRKDEDSFEKYDIVLTADSILNLKRGWRTVLNDRMKEN